MRRRAGGDCAYSENSDPAAHDVQLLRTDSGCIAPGDDERVRRVDVRDAECRGRRSRQPRARSARRHQRHAHRRRRAAPDGSRRRLEPHRRQPAQRRHAGDAAPRPVGMDRSSHQQRRVPVRDRSIGHAARHRQRPDWREAAALGRSRRRAGALDSADRQPAGGERKQRAGLRPGGLHRRGADRHRFPDARPHRHQLRRGTNRRGDRPAAFHAAARLVVGERGGARAGDAVCRRLLDFASGSRRRTGGRAWMAAPST